MIRYPIVFVVMLLLACLKILPNFEQLNMEEQVLLVQSFAVVIIATDVKDSHAPTLVCVRNTNVVNGIQKSAPCWACPMIPDQDPDI